MASVKIARVSDTRPVDPIHEPLLVTQASKVERGRNEIDENGTHKSIITIEMFPDAVFLPGELVRVGLDGETFVGRVISFNLNLGRAEKSQTLVIERSIQP